jgi:hypothetical protein
MFTFNFKNFDTLPKLFVHRVATSCLLKRFPHCNEF